MFGKEVPLGVEINSTRSLDHLIYSFATKKIELIGNM